MTFTEAAAEVLRLAGKPLHYKEITELAIEKNLLSHVGKSPEVTMGSRLASLLKKEEKGNPIVRLKPGVFGLREWEGKGSSQAEPAESDDAENNDVNALEVEAVAKKIEPLATDWPEKGPSSAIGVSGAVGSVGRVESDEVGDVRSVFNEDDALRADLVASGAELFDDEEDDDRPILGPAASDEAEDGATTTEAAQDGNRRRRRRRRRGRGNQGEERSSSLRVDGGGTPGFSVENGSGDRDGGVPARPMVRERHQIMGGVTNPGLEVSLPEGDDLSGRDLADAVVFVLGSYDRNLGPVPVRAVAEALSRKGKLPQDSAVASTQLLAAVHADNIRRRSAEQRVRFRVVGNRVLPTDWLLNPELTRAEQDVTQAVERYREVARRALLRKVSDLPGHAFVELALVALEAASVTHIKPVKRAGLSGGEVHFAGQQRTDLGETRVAIVIRKDGREVGRERVSDLRGALHHYGPATAGWVVTAGQILSGAREEALAGSAAPVTLCDGNALCKLLEARGAGVCRTTFSVLLPDVELFEALRS